MSEFLLMTLYAPLASWGEIAVGEMRGSWDRPSRSAVFGLLAAALGLTRVDQAAHDALDTGYGFAVRQDTAGMPLTDYQTAQTVAAGVLKKKRPATRKAMLEAGAHETILSWRGYRVDAMATVAIWANAGARWPLRALADAVRRPKFVLYAGRKSNPFALPLDPAVVEAATLKAAFAARPPAKAENILDWRPESGWGTEIASDAADVAFTGLTVRRREIRRDAEAQRTRWQFANRTVEISDG